MRGRFLLATALTGLAGYVDALGYLQLGSTFVSFMSGNTTRLGIGLAQHGWHTVRTIGVVIGLFVAGAAAGHLARRTAGPAAVLAVVAALLGCGGVLHDLGWPLAAVGAITLAMGAENATFEAHGEVSLGLTFVTSTLVKVGDHLADALAGGPAFGWVKPLLRWAGLLLGAVSGAYAFRAAGLDAIWPAVAVSALCAGYAARQPHPGP